MGVYRDRKNSAAIVTALGGRCWICGHLGARTADHSQARTEGGKDGSNIQPAHGSGRGKGRNPCPVCSLAAGRPVFCNQLKGGYSVERARRIIAERITANGNIADFPGIPGYERRAKPGRVW
jgi:hypothetical protein